MTRRRAAAGLLMALLVCPSAAGAQNTNLKSPEPITPASLDALHRWADAVNRHVPGRPDASVQTVTAMTYDARVELDKSLWYFIRVLRGEPLRPRDEFEQR